MLSGKERNNFWKCRETVFYSKIQCSKIFFSNDLYKLSSWYRSNIRENEDLQAACNTNCSCGFDTYDPVCSEDDVTFFNPCVAGCLVFIKSVYIAESSSSELVANPRLLRWSKSVWISVPNYFSYTNMLEPASFIFLADFSSVLFWYFCCCDSFSAYFNFF